jgi:sec-independent protein translocase protein TatA
MWQIGPGLSSSGPPSNRGKGETPMFTGLESPSHLILVLAIVLLLFRAKRIPELAKGLRTGIKEFRQWISTGENTEAEASESEQAPSGARARSGDETVSMHSGQRDL